MIDPSRRKSTFAPDPLSDLDLSDFQPNSGKPEIDKQAIQKAAEEVGFTQSMKPIGSQIEKNPEPQPATEPEEQLQSGAQEIRSRRVRSQRTIQIAMKTTPAFHERFLNLCDKASDNEGRMIPQVEMFERMIDLMEKQSK